MAAHVHSLPTMHRCDCATFAWYPQHLPVNEQAPIKHHGAFDGYTSRIKHVATAFKINEEAAQS